MLDSLRASQDAASHSGDGVPAYREIARALEEVLAGPDFQRVEPSTLGRWIAEAWSALWDLLARIPLRVPEGASAAAAWLLATAAFVVAAVVLGRWLYRLERKPWRRGGRPSQAGDGDRSATTAEWLRLAAARASEGDLRAAATALYQSVLRALDDRGVVRIHPSKTPGDYAGELSRRAGASTSASSAGSSGPSAASDRSWEANGASTGTGPAAFLHAFQRLRFGETAPTLAAYRELEEMARRETGERR